MPFSIFFLFYLGNLIFFIYVIIWSFEQRSYATEMLEATTKEHSHNWGFF